MADEITAGAGIPQTGAGQESPAESTGATQSDAEGAPVENTGVDTPECDIEAPEGAEDAQDGNDAESKETKEGDEPKGAPETYEEFKLPEGMTAAEGDLTAFQALAKELDLNQAQAQKIVDLESKRMVEMQKAQHESITKHLETVKGEWVADVRKTWGDDFDTKAADAVRAAETGSDEFRALMNGKDPKLPGIVLADHPAVAEFLATVGAQMKEAPFAKGGAGARNKSAADALYGTVDVQKPGE